MNTTRTCIAAAWRRRKQRALNRTSLSCGVTRYLYHHHNHHHHDYHPHHHHHHQTLSPSSPGALQRKLRPEDQGVDAARDPWQCEQQQRQRHLPQGACCWCCCSIQRIIISFSRTSTCSVKRTIISFSRTSTSRNSWETSSTTLMVGL